MPLEGEDDDQPFKDLKENFNIAVIAHTHLAAAQQLVLKNALLSKVEADVRSRRFTSCVVLLNASDAQQLQVRERHHVIT